MAKDKEEDDAVSVVATVVGDEQLEVQRRRYKEARKAGLSLVEAKLFGDSDTDIGQLRSLVAAGCEPRLIASILL